MTNVELYLVGGAIRDHFREKKSKDWDFAVEADSYSDMRNWIIENDFTIFEESDKYFTMRARAPKDAFQFGNFDLTGTTFDFTLCRKEANYTDGRHPDSVEVGTIHEDLARRDFTMNAIAIDKDGNVLDPYDGRADIREGYIKCVGSTERLQEDGLRVMRALRFYVQLGFDFDWETYTFLRSTEAAEALENISVDRIRQELAKALRIDSMVSLKLLQSFPHIANVIFEEKGIWLEPTTSKR